MKLGVYTNQNKDAELTVTKQVLALLHKTHLDCAVFAALASRLPQEKTFYSYDQIDTLICIGGDGTILSVASACAVANVPIIGINMGVVGFLTEIEPSALHKLIALLQDRNPIVDRRSLLEVTHEGKSFQALNDIVISRATPKMIRTEAHANGKLIDCFDSDGILICTPTGSTAYSLSAGGSIISPDAEVWGLTPINAHSLRSRPIVISDKNIVTINLIGGSDANVEIDGTAVFSMRCGDGLTISKSIHTAQFLRLATSNFYEKLLSKLNKWSNT